MQTFSPETLEAILSRRCGEPGVLIPVLQDAQDAFGALTPDVMSGISRGLGVPLAFVYGVATFYSQFTFERRGEHTVSVCMGTACYVRGADRCLHKLEQQMGIKAGETDGDGRFTLETTRCVGACGLAPVVTVDGQAHGKISEDEIDGLIGAIV